MAIVDNSSAIDLSFLSAPSTHLCIIPFNDVPTVTAKLSEVWSSLILANVPLTIWLTRWVSYVKASSWCNLYASCNFGLFCLATTGSYCPFIILSLTICSILVTSSCPFSKFSKADKEWASIPFKTLTSYSFATVQNKGCGYAKLPSCKIWSFSAGDRFISSGIPISAAFWQIIWLALIQFSSYRALLSSLIVSRSDIKWSGWATISNRPLSIPLQTIFAYSNG